MKTIDLNPLLSVIRVSGPDARAFLHAQLTCNLDQRPSDEGCLGACLTAQGKVVGSFLVLPDEADLLLVGRTDNAENVVGHLARFILRSRVTLDIVIERVLTGSIPNAEIPHSGVTCSLASIRRQQDGAWRLADGRRLAIGVAGEGDDLRAWRQYDLRQGLVMTTARHSSRFIPQMLNLDGAGGVSFRKGCYPGQEIVARARNLGRVKRGLAWLMSGTSVLAGDPLNDDTGNSVGEVIEVLATEEGFEALAVVRRDVPQASLAGEQAVALNHFSSDEKNPPETAQGSATT